MPSSTTSVNVSAAASSKKRGEKLKIKNYKLKIVVGEFWESPLAPLVERTDLLAPLVGELASVARLRGLTLSPLRGTSPKRGSKSVILILSAAKDPIKRTGACFLIPSPVGARESRSKNGSPLVYEIRSLRLG